MYLFPPTPIQTVISSYSTKEEKSHSVLLNFFMCTFVSLLYDSKHPSHSSIRRSRWVHRQECLQIIPVKKCVRHRMRQVCRICRKSCNSGKKLSKKQVE